MIIFIALVDRCVSKILHVLDRESFESLFRQSILHLHASLRKAFILISEFVINCFYSTFAWVADEFTAIRSDLRYASLLKLYCMVFSE